MVTDKKSQITEEFQRRFWLTFLPRAFKSLRSRFLLHTVSEEQRENLETIEMRQSLAVLETFKKKPKGSVGANIPPEYNKLLGKSLARGVNIQKAWTQVDIGSIVQILVQVRSRLLDFVLNLRDELPDEPSAEEKQSVDTRSLFNNAMFGNNATIIIGDKNKTDVVNHHLNGNFDALSHELKKFDVGDEDISDLQAAIESDESELTADSKEFGSSVNASIQGMLHKAVETSWQIELGMASGVLTDALKHYYGGWQ